MKTYWDSSAILAVLTDSAVAARFHRGGQFFTRTHTLSEVFSAMTGGRLSQHFSIERAAGLVRELSARLTLIDIAPSQVLEALDKAKGLGVMGGRVHDYLHAVAAQLHGCNRLLTMDRNDFAGLTGAVKVEQV